MILEPPEGFVPFELKTLHGTLTLPDRRCTACLSTWRFLSCNRCCFTWNIMAVAKIACDEWNAEIQRYIEEHPECIVHPEEQ